MQESFVKEPARRYDATNPFDTPEAQQPLLAEQYSPAPVPSDRKANCPPCRPLVYHSIKREIPEGKKVFMRKAYFGWLLHAWCLFFNSIAALGALVKGYVIGAFFISLAMLLLGLPISFYVYYSLYTALRTSSASYFGLWFCLFFLQLALELLYAIGISSTGGIGFVMMIEAFNSNDNALGILFAISSSLWSVAFLYNAFFFASARKEYNRVGGVQQTTREMGKHAAQAAYDNRAALKQVVVDNKDTIRQVVVDNKDVIKQAVADNREEIIDFVKDNRETITEAAFEHKDTIYENRDVIADVFDDHTSAPGGAK